MLCSKVASLYLPLPEAKTAVAHEQVHLSFVCASNAYHNLRLIIQAQLDTENAIAQNGIGGVTKVGKPKLPGEHRAIAQVEEAIEGNAGG